MSLLGSLVGFFICKALLDLPFYIKNWEKMLGVVLYTSMLVVPLLTILYHETSLDFRWPYIGIMVADTVLYCLLLHPNFLKAIFASFLSNTIAIIFFFIGNG